jgi:uncharacterized MAPEG superfamily protein
MPSLLSNPAFVAYTVTSLVYILMLTLLWAGSGAVRGKAKAVHNPEDTETVSKGATVVQADPPEVARVLRVHQNTLVNGLPFLFLGLIYVLCGCSGTEAWALFGGFTAIRVLYTLVYLAGKQPWRSLTFLLGVLITLALMVRIAMKVAMG